jgi:hypothetical protein
MVSIKSIQTELRRVQRIRMPENQKHQVLRNILSHDMRIVERCGRQRNYNYLISGGLVTVATLLILCGGGYTIYDHHQRANSISSLAHNNPTISSSIVRELAQVGIATSPTHAEKDFIPEKVAIANANSFLKQFKGTSTSVQLVNVSKREGTRYVVVSSSAAKGDPHFIQQQDRWKNIPCYLIVMTGVTNGMVPQGPFHGSPPQTKSLGNQTRTSSSSVSDVQTGGTVREFALVDATNGSLLMNFQVRSYAPNS